MLDIEDFKKKLDKKSRLMGIDPGRKRVGIAISDENKKFIEKCILINDELFWPINSIKIYTFSNIEYKYIIL